MEEEIWTWMRYNGKLYEGEFQVSNLGGIRSVDRYVDCHGKYCSLTCQKRDTINHRPSRDDLKEMIRNTPFVKIANSFDVTDNAVRRWCKDYNLPFTKRDIDSYSDEEWNNI